MSGSVLAGTSSPLPRFPAWLSLGYTDGRMLLRRTYGIALAALFWVGGEARAQSPLDVVTWVAEVNESRATLRFVGADAEAVTEVSLAEEVDAGRSPLRFERPSGGKLVRDGIAEVVLGEGAAWPTASAQAGRRAEGPVRFVPGGEYAYTLRAKGGFASGRFRVPAAPTSATPVTFLIYGDNRSDSAAHERVVTAMTKVPSDLLIHTGDYVDDGSRAVAWQRFFSIERPLLGTRTIFGAVGNHELLDPRGTFFVRLFAPRGADPDSAVAERRGLMRSVRWGMVQFFFLNGMDGTSTQDERAWLESSLRRAHEGDAPLWKIVVLHHGPWSSGPHGSNSRLWEAGIVDLLAREGIDLVFAGHDHLYERGEDRGMKYMVTGGGGAPLYPVGPRLATTRRAESLHHFIEAEASATGIRLAVHRVDGSILESCSMLKTTPAWSCAGGSELRLGNPGKDPGLSPRPKEKDRPLAPEASKGVDPAVWVLGGLMLLGGGVWVWGRKRRRD